MGNHLLLKVCYLSKVTKPHFVGWSTIMEFLHFKSIKTTVRSPEAPIMFNILSRNITKFPRTKETKNIPKPITRKGIKPPKMYLLKVRASAQQQ